MGMNREMGLGLGIRKYFRCERGLKKRYIYIRYLVLVQWHNYGMADNMG